MSTPRASIEVREMRADQVQVGAALVHGKTLKRVHRIEPHPHGVAIHWPTGWAWYRSEEIVQVLA